MWSDLVLSLRRIRRHPGMWLVVILNLAIGLSGVIAAFSVVRAVLLRQLPYPDPQQLVVIWEDNSQRGVGLTPNSALNIRDVKAAATSFQKLGLLFDDTVTLYGRTDAEPIKVYRVSPEVFAVAGVQPLLGRALTTADEDPGSPKVIVLSYGFWQRRFGGDPGIVGREILLGGDAYTVAGVMPSGFGVPPTFRTLLVGSSIVYPEAELWLALKTSELPPIRRIRSHMALARLKPGVSQADAQNEMHVIARRLAADFPDANVGMDYAVIGLQEQALGNVRPVLIVLFVAAVLVLLLSIANAVHILLVDLSHRLSELALRSALGATPFALVRQLATMSVAACAIATVAALGGAQAIVALVSRASDAGVARLSETTIDGPVILFTLAVAIAVAFATTALAFRQVAGRQIAGVVRDALAGGVTRRVLLVTHVVIVIVVLAVAGALTRSWWRVSAVNPGIRADGVMVLEMLLPESRYATPAQRVAFERRLLAEVEGAGLPESAVVDYYPFGDDSLLANITVEKRIAKDASDEPRALGRAVSAGYFQTLAIPLVRGRLFDAHDDVAAPICVVSEAFARRYGDGQEMVGRRLKISTVDPNLWFTIIGIVGSTHGAGLTLPAQPEVLFPYGLLAKRPNVNLLVHPTGAQAGGAREPALGAVTAALARVDPQLKPTVTDLSDRVSMSMGRSRLYGRIFLVLAAIALVLGVSGIYGAQSLLVSRRSRDIGVRLCLGAESDAIIRGLLARFVGLGAIGVAAGIAAAALAQRQLADVLFGVEAPDWLTIGGSALLVIAMGIVATYVPARHACRQPLRALLDDVTMRASG